MNGTKSNWSVVQSGVPQGTELGPVLFSLHINDILDSISSDIRFFADDCVCYRVIDSTEDCKILQNYIVKLGSWARKWGMRFQPIKCNMMKQTRKNHYIDFDYQLDGTKLEFFDINYFGVNIANDLRWNKHVHEVTNKANKLLGMLRRNLYVCTKDVRETAYLSLARSILEYARTVWDPNCLNLENYLEKVLKRAGRFVMNNYSFEEGSMTSIMNELGWTKLKQSRQENRLILLNKGLNGYANIPISDITQNKRKQRKGHNHQFQIPHARTDIFKDSFIPKTLKDWNQLDPNILQKSTSDKDPTSTFAELIISDRFE